MIKTLIQENNKSAEIIESVDKLSRNLGKKGAFLWIDVQKPTQKEMRFLEERLVFHPLAIEDCMTTIQRPKIDRYEGYLFVVLHAATLAAHKDKATSLELDCFVGENYVVTVHLKTIPSVTATWDRCIKNRSIMSRGSAYLFYFIADALVDNYFPILEKLDAEIQRIEDNIFKNSTAVLLNKIFDLKENVLILRRILGPQRETMNVISRGGYYPLIPSDLSIYFRDVSDLLARINDNLDTYRDLLVSALDGYMSATSNKLSEIMKVLTIIATIMMPLTLITGVYGMNFKNMPELNNPYAYFIVIGFMFLLGISMLLFFKRKKWL